MSADPTPRSTRTLLAAIVVSGVTTFMFYPLITLELLDRGQSPGEVGIILGLLSGTGQIASTFIGRVNAEWGSRRLAVGGLILRSGGLAIFAIDASTAFYAAGAVIAGMGSSSTALAIKTELMRTSTSRRTITLRSIAVNIGALIGPSIGGAFFVATTFAAIVVAVVTSYVALALVLLTIRFHPPENAGLRPAATPKRSFRQGDRDSSFLLLLACVFGYWAIYAQWALVVPVFASQGFGTPVASTWVYTGNAVLILLLQYLVLVKGLAGHRSTRILGLGFACFVASFAIITLPPSPAAVVVFATLFSISEMLISPTLDEITGRLRADGSGLTRAYGVTGTVGGVASLVGAPIGGMLIERLDGPGGVLWIGAPLALIGMIAALVLGRREASL
jgi:predicted MFS family arabinose efflux permease